jgi:hypothetical protein
MPSSPPDAGVTDAAIFASYLSEFFAIHGLRQCDVVRTAKELNPNPRKDNWLYEADLTISTLSRILNGTANGKPRKNAPRWKIFNIIVLSGLHVTWAAKGQVGSAPGNKEVDQVWNDWQEFRKKKLEQAGLAHPSQEVPNGTSSTPSPEGGEAVRDKKPGMPTAEQRKYENDYSAAGVSLFAEARTGDGDAALLLGVLRTVDGHHKEGETWLQSARSLGRAQAVELLDATNPEGRKRTAVRHALELALRLSSVPGSRARKELLLERAALGGSREGALLLAAHYEELGESGHAARWRQAAA